jgi:hypothetical protein
MAKAYKVTVWFPQEDLQELLEIQYGPRYTDEQIADVVKEANDAGDGFGCGGSEFESSNYKNSNIANLVLDLFAKRMKQKYPEEEKAEAGE